MPGPSQHITLKPVTPGSHYLSPPLRPGAGQGITRGVHLLATTTSKAGDLIPVPSFTGETVGPKAQEVGR